MSNLDREVDGRAAGGKPAGRWWNFLVLGAFPTIFFAMALFCYCRSEQICAPPDMYSVWDLLTDIAVLILGPAFFASLCTALYCSYHLIKSGRWVMSIVGLGLYLLGMVTAAAGFLYVLGWWG